MTALILDCGPLVAYYDDRDQWHKWAVGIWAGLQPPFITCEAALTEACFLIGRHGGDPAELVQLVQKGIFQIGLNVAIESASIHALMRRYADTPMSLADACLVRLAEIHPDCRVLTLDRDFLRYRRHGRQVIPLLSPW